MKNQHLIKRGSIFYCTFNKRKGAVQRGTRPVMIIQNDMGNLHSPTTIVAPITSIPKKLYLPTHIYIGTQFGLLSGSTLLTEQITTIDKRYLSGFIGMASSEFMKQVDEAVSISIGTNKKAMLNDFDVCLCSDCLRLFFSSHNFEIRRINKQQSEKNLCAYCRQQMGYDYRIACRDEV